MPVSKAKETQEPNPRLTDRFREAFSFALDLHVNQPRKGTVIPYMAHLMAVAGLILENGGDEDEAIAGLLHDAVEDQGGKPVLDEIRRRFGHHIASIVDGCTDAYESPKPPWLDRKTVYIAKLRHESASVRLVSAADKLHNVRCILEDYRVCGERVWERFNGRKEGTLWYYRELGEVFHERGPSRLADELNRVVSELESLVN